MRVYIFRDIVIDVLQIEGDLDTQIEMFTNSFCFEVES